jgi:hypothetical protein
MDHFMLVHLDLLQFDFKLLLGPFAALSFHVPHRHLSQLPLRVSQRGLEVEVVFVREQLLLLSRHQSRFHVVELLSKQLKLGLLLLVCADD